MPAKKRPAGDEPSKAKNAKKEDPPEATETDDTSMTPEELAVKTAIEEICKLAKDDVEIVVDSERVEDVEKLEEELGFKIPADLRLYWTLTGTEKLDKVQSIKDILEMFEEDEGNAMFGKYNLVPTKYYEAMTHDVLDMASGHMVMIDHESDEAVCPIAPSFQEYMAILVREARDVHKKYPEKEKTDFYDELNCAILEAADESFKPRTSHVQKFSKKWQDEVNG
ncbi:hypothetical protein DIPPA_11490 [Diplonema papillatum]|nr:hypothetical protein DIPPA_11490 [Diplonema papillatum]